MLFMHNPKQKQVNFLYSSDTTRLLVIGRGVNSLCQKKIFSIEFYPIIIIISFF